MFILLPAEVVMQILEPNKVLSVENNTTFSVSTSDFNIAAENRRRQCWSNETLVYSTYVLRYTQQESKNR